MRIVFAGTPEFAAVPLRALLDAAWPVTAVYTQPDRPAGRGRKLTASPVKQLAQAHALPVYQPASLRDPDAQAQLAALRPDLLIVIAYGLILPPAVLSIPSLACVNLHASMLPRWRGAAPIQRAIEAGDTRTGLCLMQMDAGLDTGPVLAQASWPIDAQCSAGELHDALAALGAERLPVWLTALQAGELQPKPQDEALATYAHKLSKADSRLDWSQDADVLARRVRAFNPWPVACAELHGQSVKLWAASARPERGEAAPGEIFALTETGLQVACGSGSLVIREMQFPGGRRLPAAEIARGRSLLGERFATVTV